MQLISSKNFSIYFIYLLICVIYHHYEDLLHRFIKKKYYLCALY